MPGTIWQNPTTLEVNADTTLEYQVFTSNAGQTLYTLTDFSYAVGTKSLLLFRNNQVLVPGLDFTELSPTTFSLGTPSNLGDQILAYGFVGITAELPGGGGSGGDIIVVDDFTIVKNYPITDPEVLLYARGRDSDNDGYEGLFMLRFGQPHSNDNENYLLSAYGDGVFWVRLGAPATETIAGVSRLARLSDIPTLTATDRVVSVSRFPDAFNSMLHGYRANGLTHIMIFDLDTLFYNIGQVIIAGNANSPLPVAEEGWLTVQMGDSILDGVQTVIGNGATSLGQVWRRFVVGGVWDTWVDITPIGRTVILDTPELLVAGSTSKQIWTQHSSVTLSNANADAAILTINARGTTTANMITLVAYARKYTGSGGAGTSLVQACYTVNNQAATDSFTLNARQLGAITVKLDENHDFEWLTNATDGGGGSPEVQTSITLIGYITR